MIPFNKPSIKEIERNHMHSASNNLKICGDGVYTHKVYDIFKEKLNINNLLLTTSCSHALDMTSILADFKEGDEIIAPSYTFVSTINAFVLRGAKPIFCDVEKETMNIDAEKIEELITPKTKAIYPVHYAGVICDMDKINSIAKKHNLLVIEDAAQAVGSYYKGTLPAGTIGDMGCYSFHETKNYVMGEGGALVVKDDELFKKAEIIREKGTDRSQFIRGEVDKYTWRMVGSSYLPSDILAAMLYGQMERFDEIMQKRMSIWNSYYEGLADLEKEGKLIRPFIPEYTTHNAHMFYIILPSKDIRDKMILKLREKGISTVFHYIPLHSSPMGETFGYKKGDLPITEEYSERLLRLPMFVDLTESETQYIIRSIKECL